MSDSALVDEFVKEYKDKEIKLKCYPRQIGDPKPIAIKDESGEKVASYGLDMVR